MNIDKFQSLMNYNDCYLVLIFYRLEKYQLDIKGMQEIYKIKKVILSKFSLKLVKLLIRSFVVYLDKRLENQVDFFYLN